MSLLDAIAIPDKTYFKIGEVAKLLDLEPYVLRYWESEFDVLDPDKTDSGQRVYQRDDIELVCQIRDLLYNEMFTIAGARRQLELERNGEPCYATEVKGAGADSDAEAFEAENRELRQQLDELAARLEASEQQRTEADDTQPDLWEERLASQSAQIDQLEAELAEARQTVAKLEEQSRSRPSGGLDPRLMRGLRDQIESLARLSQRPV
jgi:DNA-binding transcriptional MerR regulator